MNLVLLTPEELAPDGTARLGGRRAGHVLDVLRPSPGDRLTIGVRGGRIGSGIVRSLGPAEVVIEVQLERAPPPRAPLDLLVALPRPKILRRVLQCAASLGVRRLVLLGSYKVEKSYWASPFLAPEAMDAQVALGLEQGKDTVAPEILVRRFFKPFVEDELEAAFAGTHRLLAHPTAAEPLARIAPREARAAIAIGPEGGWTPYEAARLEEHGFAPITFGERVLRVDVAVPFAAGAVLGWIEGRGG